MISGRYGTIPDWAKYALDGDGELYTRSFVPETWIPLSKKPSLTVEEMANKARRQPLQITFYSADPR